MNHRDYAYEDVDGKHFPDCFLGSAEYYSIDFQEWLSQENETLVEVEWELPAEVVGSDDFNSETEAFVRLAPQTRGTHEIRCKLSFTEDGLNGTPHTQQKMAVMMLKVN